ncbi:TPA: hypothetical protein DEP90_00385 [Patescibacteria group bacterium]|nr:hypothetical protein [Patescibacteria group bacterium]
MSNNINGGTAPVTPQTEIKNNIPVETPTSTNEGGDVVMESFPIDSSNNIIPKSPEEILNITSSSDAISDARGGNTGVLLGGVDKTEEPNPFRELVDEKLNGAESTVGY